MRRAALLLTVLLLAACGGGGGGGDTRASQPVGPPLTKAQYESQLQAIGKDISSRLGSTLSSTKKNSKKAVDQGVRGLRRFADELAKINPPPEIAQLHRDLIAGTREFADELPDLIARLDKTNEASEALTIVFSSKSFQKLAKVQQELKKRGYKFDLAGS
jgi:hypothetical protein